MSSIFVIGEKNACVGIKGETRDVEFELSCGVVGVYGPSLVVVVSVARPEEVFDGAVSK